MRSDRRARAGQWRRTFVGVESLVGHQRGGPATSRGHYLLSEFVVDAVSGLKSAPRPHGVCRQDGSHRQARRPRRVCRHGRRRHGPADAVTGAAKPAQRAEALDNCGWRLEHIHAPWHGDRRNARRWLSDRIGRSRVTWWAVLIFTVCTGLIAFCNTYLQIAFMRFVSGFGLGRGLQRRHAAHYGIRPYLNTDDGTRHPSRRLVDRFRCRRPVVVVRASRLRLALVVLLRHRARRARAPDVAQRARSAKLVRSAKERREKSDVRSLRGDSWSPVVVARLSSGR
jgi:hypothetical protein